VYLIADAQSDLSKLSDECKRMMDNGCDWLHMGESGAECPHSRFDSRATSLCSPERC
jgi:hypothetical protein